MKGLVGAATLLVMLVGAGVFVSAQYVPPGGGGGVPYTGATADLNLGTHNIFAANLGVVAVESHIASSSAALQFTTGITSAYSDYELRCQDLIPSGSGPSFFIQMSTNGGSSYDSSAIYDLAYENIFSVSVTAGAQANQTALGIVGAISNSANYGLNVDARLVSPLSTALYKKVFGNIDFLSTTNLYMNRFNGVYKSTTAVNAIQVYFDSSDTIVSGVCTLYGWAN